MICNTIRYDTIHCSVLRHTILSCTLLFLIFDTLFTLICSVISLISHISIIYIVRVLTQQLLTPHPSLSAHLINIFNPIGCELIPAGGGTHDIRKDGKDRKIAVNALYSLPCKKNPEVPIRRLLLTAPQHSLSLHFFDSSHSHPIPSLKHIR